MMISRNLRRAWLLMLPLAVANIAAAGEPCTCATARLENGWCAKCKVGYVASFPIHSQVLYDAIHPHGHYVDTDGFYCTTCHKAYRTNGFCRSCRMGFVGGQAYFSRIAHLLARGKSIDPDTVTCPTCRACMRKFGWCDKCDVGWLGNVRFKKPVTLQEIEVQATVLFNAIAASERCVDCAIAIVNDSRCPRCHISYRDGKPLDPAHDPPHHGHS